LHCLFVSLGQRLSGSHNYVTEYQARVTVPKTAEKFVHVPGVYTETIHTQIPKVWQSVLSTVSTAQYLASVSLFPIHQSHQRFLIIIHVAGIPPSGNETYGTMLQKPFFQQSVAGRRDRYRL
jgi:hypothetical protein